VRRAMMVGVAPVCVALFLTQANAQQSIAPGDGAGAVTGTVPALNHPPVFTVRGTVNVGNLPLDAQGNLKVSGGGGAQAAPVAHFVGVAIGTVERQQGFDPEYPILAMSPTFRVSRSARRAAASDLTRQGRESRQGGGRASG